MRHVRYHRVWKWLTAHFHQRLTRDRLTICVSEKRKKKSRSKTHQPKHEVKNIRAYSYLAQASTFSPTSPTLCICGTVSVTENLGKTTPEKNKKNSYIQDQRSVIKSTGHTSCGDLPYFFTSKTCENIRSPMKALSVYIPT